MGSYSETDLVTRVWMLLRDYGGTTAEQLLTDDEIKALGCRGAEQVYSRLVPNETVSDLTANGTSFLALPSGYLPGFSTVVSVETPPDRVPAEIMDPRDYYLGRDGTGALRFVWMSPPANNATVRVTYTKPRVIAASAVNTTILDPDFVAFADLAASICADAIAAKYARTSEPAINAEVVNYRTRAQEWQAVAKRLWQRWEQQMGVGSGAEGGSAPATSAWVNWDMAASWGNFRFNHPRSSR